MSDALEVPRSYAALHQAGRLDAWGAPYESLTPRKRKAILPARQLATLWWNGIEWNRDLSPGAVARTAGYGIMRPGLFPFAGNGCGDHFCWYPRWKKGADVPVVMFIHDEYESRLFARNFDECLVRCMLQSNASWDLARDGDAARMKQVWKAHLAILSTVLPSARLKLLTSLTAELSPEACMKADAGLGRKIGERTLVGALQPTKFTEEYFEDKRSLLRSYQNSLKFYAELVDVEGRSEFRTQLAEVRANRDRVAKSLK